MRCRRVLASLVLGGCLVVSAACGGPDDEEPGCRLVADSELSIDVG